MLGTVVSHSNHVKLFLHLRHLDTTHVASPEKPGYYEYDRLHHRHPATMQLALSNIRGNFTALQEQRGILCSATATLVGGYRFSIESLANQSPRASLSATPRVKVLATPAASPSLTEVPP